MTSIIRNQHLRVLLPPIAGLLFYGGWAFIINYSHGFEKAINAALTQGGYSFVITLMLALIVEWLFVRLSHFSWRNTMVFIIAMFLLAITSFTLNRLTGTPEILLTILPGLIVSGVYTLLYIFALLKVESN